MVILRVCSLKGFSMSVALMEYCSTFLLKVVAISFVFSYQRIILVLPSLMLPQVAFIIVSPAASILALKGSIFNVHTCHVLLQLVCLSKCFGAKVTLKLPLFMVCCNMQFQVASAGESS